MMLEIRKWRRWALTRWKMTEMAFSSTEKATELKNSRTKMPTVPITPRYWINTRTCSVRAAA